jgi:hypothetical protein
MPTDLPTILTLTKLLVAAIFFVSGLVLVRGDGGAFAQIAQPPPVRASARRVPAGDTRRMPARLAPGAELKRLSSIFESFDTCVSTIKASQTAANVQIDAAEHALNRLIAEIAAVMPVAPRPLPGSAPGSKTPADRQAMTALAA